MPNSEDKDLAAELEVVAGNPTKLELAALVAVLREAVTTTESAQPEPNWAKGSQMLRESNGSGASATMPAQLGVQTQPAVTQPALVMDGQEKPLPPVETAAKPSLYNQRIAEKQGIENTIRTYSDPQFAGNERAIKIVDQSLKRLEAVNKEISKVSVSDLSGDLGAFRASVPEQFRPAIDNLMAIAEKGEITGDQYAQKVVTLQKEVNDYRQKELDFLRAQTNYQSEEFRVAQKVAPGVDPKDYTPEILAKIQAELKAEEKELRIAGRNITTVSVGEKKFAEEFGRGVAGAVQKTYDNALTAQSTLSTIKTIKPLIQEGVYSGPLSSSAIAIDRVASALGFASGTIEDKLVRTTQAMQGLASLELDAAKVLAGQGTITDFERGLIAQTAGGNFAKLTAKEVNALLIALEKVANSKISIHKNNLNRLRKRKDTAELADFYELDGGNSLEDAVSEELRRRGQ